MTRTMRIACAEVDAILKEYLPTAYSDKLPEDMKKALENYKLPDYKVTIDKSKSLKDQKFIRDTYIILASFRLNFWCDSEEDKKALEKMFKENDNLLSQKYDISSLNTSVEDVIGKPVTNEAKNLPVKYEKHSWFTSLIEKIKKIFKK